MEKADKKQVIVGTIIIPLSLWIGIMSVFPIAMDLSFPFMKHIGIYEGLLFLLFISGIGLLLKQDWAIISTFIGSSSFSSYWLYFTIRRLIFNPYSRDDWYLIFFPLTFPFFIILVISYSLIFKSFKGILKTVNPDPIFPYFLICSIFGLLYLWIYLTQYGLL